MRTGTSDRGPLQGLRILVADDEALIALEMEFVLSEAGAFVVGPFMTVADALVSASSAELAAAVLDIRLGSETTAAVALRLSERRIPFLFYSGQSLPEDMRLHAATAPLLSKPAREGEVVAELARIAHAEGPPKRPFR